MKLKVDLDDFYLDEEDDLVPAIKDFVVNKVTSTIWDRVEEKIKQKILDLCNENIQKIIDEKIETYLTEMLDKEMIKKDRWSDELVSLQEYVSTAFNKDFDNNYRKILERIVEDKTKNICEEIKKRYDLLFASQLISKMNDQNMLKEDIAKLILDKS
jgi:hypothetical protein